MRRPSGIAASLGWLAVASAALAADAQDDFVRQVQQNRRDLAASHVGAPPAAAPQVDLTEAIRRLESVVLQRRAAAEPAASAATAPPAAEAPPPAAKPVLGPEDLARIKALPPDAPPDAAALADALYLAGHLEEAGALYERLAAAETATPATKAWALFQSANCLRQRDRAAAIARYARLVTEYADSPWVEPAKVHTGLLQWLEQAKPQPAARPAAATPGPAPEQATANPASRER